MNVDRVNYHFYGQKRLFMKNIANILVNTYYNITNSNAKSQEGKGNMRDHKSFIRFRDI